MLTAEDILKAEAILKMVNPGDLFSNDETTLKSEYKNLAKQWHPDLHPSDPIALEVMTKINKLYDEGLQQLRDGKWVKANFIQFKTVDGKLYRVNYLAKHAFELGKMYICNNAVFYVVDKRHKLFYDNYINRVSNLKYANSDMKTEFEKYLPVIESRFETDDYFGVIVRKPNDVLSLRDVLSFYNGSMPDRHMAWVLSTLYNIACFLHFNKLSHNGITVDNYFISPQFHSGMLLGGWWYSVPYSEKLIGAPKEVFDVMTLKTKSEKVGTFETDSDSIRQVGRILIADRLGASLLKHPTIPKVIVDWLLGGATKKPFDEYEAWGKALDMGWGKRTFVEMKVTVDDLYSKGVKA